nr:hypothetical protein B0A51_00917 [Rachicladosporium sp. CCFEE 5018]
MRQLELLQEANKRLDISFRNGGLRRFSDPLFRQFTHQKLNTPLTKDDQAYQDKIMRQLRQGGYEDVNIYIVEQINDTRCIAGRGSRTAGFCRFPKSPSDTLHGGCFVDIDSLPGVAFRRTPNNFGTGTTLVHEIGHWFGLRHIFHSDTPGVKPTCDKAPDYLGVETPFYPGPGQFDAFQFPCCQLVNNQFGNCAFDRQDHVTNWMSYSQDKGKVDLDLGAFPWTKGQDDTVRKCREFGIECAVWQAGKPPSPGCPLLLISTEQAVDVAFLTYASQLDASEQLARVVIEESHLVHTAQNYGKRWNPLYVRSQTMRADLQYDVQKMEASPSHSFEQSAVTLIQHVLAPPQFAEDSERSRALVFTRSRRQADEVAAALGVARYHSDSGSAVEKAAVIADWIQGRHITLVATSALAGLDYGHVGSSCAPGERHCDRCCEEGVLLSAPERVIEQPRVESPDMQQDEPGLGGALAAQIIKQLATQFRDFVHGLDTLRGSCLLCRVLGKDQV